MINNKAAIDRTLLNIEKRGFAKLNEIPETLREMADEIERRLKRESTVHCANHVVTVQLRNLDAHVGMLRECVSSTMSDYARVIAVALKEAESDD
jgi:hypothetical protein